MTWRKIRRAALAGTVAIVVAGGIGIASAATLGGIESKTFGADDGAVLACDSDGVTLSYQYEYDNTDQRYEVTGATVGSTNSSCSGHAISVTLTGAGGVGLATSTQTTVGSSSATVAFATPPSAEAVVGASILITG